MSNVLDRPSQELPSNISPANITEDIIAGSPEELRKIIGEDYKEDISALSPDKQKMLLEKWRGELPKNIGIFDSLIRQIEKSDIQNKEVSVQNEKVSVQNEKVSVQNEKVSVQNEKDVKKEQTSEKLETANSTAKKALEFGKNIKEVVGDIYKGDIQESIVNDIQDKKTQEYFSSLGIDLTNQEILGKPETQNILLARASVRVYTKNQDKIIGKHPELQGSLDNLNSLRFGLGIEETSTAKDVNKLLTDIPKDTRGQLVDTVTSLTASNPDTRITRTGDRLTFSDPKNDKYSYEIDLSKQPPRLAKTRNGLSISRNIEALSEEKKELQKLKGGVGSLIKERTTKQPIIEKHQKTIESVNTDMIDTAVTDGKNPELKQSLDAYKKSKTELNKMDGKSKIEALNNLESARVALIEKKRVILNPDGSNSAEFNVLEKSLEDEAIAIRELRDIEKNINIPLADQQKKLDTLQGKTQETGDDGFENSANYNLNFLSKIGYDGIGQDNMERIIRTLNSSQNPSRSSVGEIDLNQKLDTPKTQALTLAIANLVRNGRTSTGQVSEEQKKTEESQKSYDNVDKSDPYIAARQTQSLGFRESLSSVARNMSQEGGSLKTDTAMKKVLFGTTESTEVKLPEANSAILKVPTTLA